MPRKPAGVFGRVLGRASTRRAATIAVIVTTGLCRTAYAGEDDLSLDLGGKPLELRRIPKGTFLQGSAADANIREPDELQRSVTLTRSFWMGKVPVTRGQFAKFVAETRFVTEAEKSTSGGFGWDGHALVQKKEFTWRNPGFVQKDEDPVVIVTFADANAFAAWASRKASRRVRLPTEAEWEYAARGGTTTPWFGASKEDEALALGWYKQNALWTTHPVGQKKPNPFGLFDMGGNIFQWCRDVYAPYPAGEAIDPENAAAGTGELERRVLRGGSWMRDPKRGRSAARHKSAPGSRNADYGFRVVVEDDGAIAPAPSAVPASDFAPAAPVGAGSSTPSAVEPSGATSASASASAVLAPARAPAEGSPWTLVIAPFASAGAAVLWVLARRRRRELEVIESTWSTETAALEPVSPPVPPRAPSVPPPSHSPSYAPPPLTLPSPPASVPLRASVPPPLPPSTRLRVPTPSPPSSFVGPPTPSTAFAPPSSVVGPPTPAAPFVPVALESVPIALDSASLIESDSSPSLVGPPPSRAFVPAAPAAASSSSVVGPPSPPRAFVPVPPPSSSVGLEEDAAPSEPLPPPTPSPFAISPSAAPPPISPFPRSPSAPPPPMTTDDATAGGEMQAVEASMRRSIAEGLIALSLEAEAEEAAAKSAAMNDVSPTRKDEATGD